MITNILLSAIIIELFLILVSQYVTGGHIAEAVRELGRSNQ